MSVQKPNNIAKEAAFQLVAGGAAGTYVNIFIISLFPQIKKLKYSLYYILIYLLPYLMYVQEIFSFTNKTQTTNVEFIPFFVFWSKCPNIEKTKNQLSFLGKM